MTIEKAYALLRERNTGLIPDGKTFGEVMPHYIIGGDETCFLACSGDVNIIGDKDKKKHEQTVGNSRVSVTLYRTGSAAGVTGPTAFLPPGQRRRTGFTDNFLVENGAADGSTIVMTATGYMTEEAWVELAPKMAYGLRGLPVVKDTPN